MKLKSIAAITSRAPAGSAVHRGARVLALLVLLVTPALVGGQAVPATSPVAAEASAASAQLDSLVAHALEVNPTIRAARQRVDAARARIGPAGT
ncbi:MAG: hypothetical protein ACRELX_05990, partial [Longimicrobiales bacterium]